MRRHAKAPSAGSNAGRGPKLLVVLSFGLLALLVLGAALATATAPVVTIEDVNPADVTYNSAKASGHVNAEDKETSYHFEYVDQARFEASEWAEASFEGFGSLAAGEEADVSPTLEGLKPGTTYHLRLFASNEDGEDIAVAPSTFTTDPVNLPGASSLAVSAVTGTSAHFSATVNSGGAEPGEATEYRFSCTPECPGLPVFQPATSDGAGHTVQVDATGLEPNTTYTVTVTARNAGGEDEDKENFETDAIAPSEVVTGGLPGIIFDSVHLHGTVNPHNSPTSYWFDYGTTAAYGSTTPHLDLGKPTNSPQFASYLLEGLEPSTTYHYRIVVDNGVGGPVAGADRSFTTEPPKPTSPSCPNEAIRAEQGATFLPDCMAYELVSPPDKNNGFVYPQGARFSADGSRVLFTIASGHNGGGVLDPEVSVRTPSGWQAHTIMPPSPQRPYPIYFLGAYAQNFDAFVGRSTGQFIGFPPTPSTLVRLDGEGGQSILREFSVGVNASGAVNGFGDAAASDDLSHVFASIGLALDPADSNGAEDVYDFGTEPPTLASRMPGPGGEADPVAACGAGVNVSSVFSYLRTWDDHAVSRDGSVVFFTSLGDGPCDTTGALQLYRRDFDPDPDQSGEPAQSDLVSPLLPVPGTGPSRAEFIRASADGSRVLYGTFQHLAGVPADTDGSADLYLWDEQDGNSCLTCGLAPEPTAIFSPGGGFVSTVAVSEDLSRFYFISKNALAPGAAPGQKNLYALHAGQLDFVAPGAESVCDRPVVDCTSDLTPDGRFLIFKSNAPGINALTEPPSDNGGQDQQGQLYRYDAVTKALTCVSCAPDGSPTVGGPEGGSLLHGNLGSASSTYVRVISDDGQRVYFNSSADLLAGDGSESGGLYQWHDGQLALVADGASLLDVSRDGSEILFASSARLTFDVADSANQLYVARANGGFPAPPPAPRPCGGDGCQGAPSGPPAEPGAATPSFAGPPNPKPRHKKRRAHKRKKQQQKQRANRGSRR